MDTFGAWLRQQRDQLKLTRAQFASRIGCSVALLRKIEDGERHPSEQIAELIANCLDIPPRERDTFVKVARGELNVERLPTAPRPVSDKPTPRINLPLLPTPLIGRQHEIEEINHLLHDPQCRLLTLAGPGGIGKTRLAIESATRVQDAFSDGVYFIPLSPVSSTRFIVPVIADALGFSFQGAGSPDPKMQLFSYMKDKQVLLLADNLEHLLTEPGIEVLAEILAHAPQVKLLATSRESLELQGEWVYEVQGLPVPESIQAEESAQDTSVELFLQRARRADVGFNATPNDFPTILHICQLVAGIPLAIELAAAWVRVLSCDEIADEIEGSVDFLSVSTRDLPARHRSMRAVFDQSWKLITREEQDILLRLSVFRGGFQREAAEQVASATLPVLSSLVTKSLIRRVGSGRYDLHELIRQFIDEHFAEQPAEQASTQASHSNYFLSFYSQADGRLKSSQQRETLNELSVELDNLRSAWDWAVAHGEFALIEQALRTLAMLFDTRGWWQEGIDILDRAICTIEFMCEQAPSAGTYSVALGHLLVCRALFTSRLGQHEQAQAMFTRSLEIIRPLNQPKVLVEAITFLGNVMELVGDYAGAEELYSEGLEIATTIGDRWFATLCRLCHTGLIGVTQMLIKPETTHDRLQSVLADWRAIGDPRMIAMTLNNLSWNAQKLGLYSEASTALEESVTLFTSIGDHWGLAFAYRGLGTIAQIQGDHSQAVKMFRKGLDTLTELGARQDQARVLTEMSRSFLALGNDADAERTLRTALHITDQTQGTFVALEALISLAALQAKRGDIETALEFVYIVLNHPSSTQNARDHANRLHTELQGQLTSEQLEAVQVRAKAKSLPAVVNKILE